MAEEASSDCKIIKVKSLVDYHGIREGVVYEVAEARLADTVYVFNDFGEYSTLLKHEYDVDGDI